MNHLSKKKVKIGLVILALLFGGIFIAGSSTVKEKTKPEPSVEKAQDLTQRDLAEILKSNETSEIPVPGIPGEEPQPPNFDEGAEQETKSDQKTEKQPEIPTAKEPSEQEKQIVMAVTSSTLVYKRKESDASEKAGTVEPVHIKTTPYKTPYVLFHDRAIKGILEDPIDTQLEGRVCISISADVKDSQAGKHILIPKGTKLTGTYSTKTNWSDNRIKVSLNEMRIGNNKPVSLEKIMVAGSDGAMGVKGETHRDWGGIMAFILINSALDAGSGYSRRASSTDPSIQNEFASDVVGDTAKTGKEVVQENFDFKPRIVAKAGESIRVSFAKDLVFSKPYEPDYVLEIEKMPTKSDSASLVSYHMENIGDVGM